LTRNGAGYTLIELLVAVAASTVVLGSVGLVLRSSLDAQATVRSEADALFATRFALSRMASRLRNAVSLSETTATAVTFTAAKAPDAAATEAIRYAWSGVAGEPLMESVDGAPPVAIAPHVAHLSFSYLADTEVRVALQDPGDGSTRRMVLTEDVLNVIRIDLTVEQDGKTARLVRDLKMRNL